MIFIVIPNFYIKKNLNHDQIRKSSWNGGMSSQLGGHKRAHISQILSVVGFKSNFGALYHILNLKG